MSMRGVADGRSTPCAEGDEFDGTRVFRAVWDDRWRAGEPYPPLKAPVPPGRWNDNQQATIYTSHEPAVALREKLERLGPETWAGSLLVASGRPLRASIVVVGFKPLDVQTYDARTEQDPDALFSPLLGSDYAPAQAFSRIRRELGDASLIVPSAPLFRDTRRLRWNRVFFVGGSGQPVAEVLPSPSEMSVECEVALAEVLSGD
jgi:RES domain-containing protein